MKTNSFRSGSEELLAYSAVYRVPIAAALWCGVPATDAESFLQDSSVEVGRGVFESPFVENLEVRCRALHHAIERGLLHCCGEHGKIIEGYVAPEKRYVARRDLKQWMAQEFESEKPSFLFGETERRAHVDTLRRLREDRDVLTSQMDQLKACYAEVIEGRDRLTRELNAVAAKSAPERPIPARAETTYLNIIGALLDLLVARSPSDNRRSLFPSQAAVITAVETRFPSKEGLSQRTLHDKFAAAKRSLDK
jgi:hypothetical protein